MDFETLFEEYYGKIYAYIARRVNNTACAEDLTADVFLKAFANPYNPQLAKFSTYVYTIASNVLKDYYRIAGRRINTLSGDEPDEVLPDNTDILSELITKEECAELQKVLAALPERQYDIIYRRYYLEQPFKEISAVMGVSESGARKLHFDTIKKLRATLNKSSNECRLYAYTQAKGGG